MIVPARPNACSVHVMPELCLLVTSHVSQPVPAAVKLHGHCDPAWRPRCSVIVPLAVGLASAIAIPPPLHRFVALAVPGIAHLLIRVSLWDWLKLSVLHVLRPGSDTDT